MKMLERIKLSTLSKEVNVLGKSESARIFGGQYTGSDGNVYYTEDEMDQMMDAGTWSGGLIEGVGYIGSSVNVYPSGYVTGSYDSTSRDLFEAPYPEGLDAMASKMLDYLTAGISGQVQDQFNEMGKDFAIDAIDAGLSLDSPLHIIKTSQGGDNTTYTVYDTDNNEISSGVYNVYTGWTSSTDTLTVFAGSAEGQW